MQRRKASRTRALLANFFIFLLLIGSILSCATRPSGPYLSPLASPPNWAELEPFQETLTRDEFARLLRDVYTQAEIYKKYISIESDHALIQTSRFDAKSQYRIRLAQDDSHRLAPPDTSRGLPNASNPTKPLAGLKIAIDPGHIGGAWARDEDRWFKLGNYPPVAEGEITLIVSQLLRKKLEALGADVFLVRDRLEPLTPLRPEGLRDEALAALQNRSPGNRREYSEGEILEEAKVLAYRTAELRERARLISRFKPDFTLVVHFNAADWGDPDKPRMVEENHLHLIVHGSYTPSELDYDDIRFEMLRKLLSGSHGTEMELSRSVARSMRAATGLPPAVYPPGLSAKRMSDDGHLWAHNLLANRLYPGPVIFFEPYVMNNPEVYQRLITGDYEGKRWVAGQWRKSIFREYADSVVEGILKYYQRQGHQER